VDSGTPEEAAGLEGSGVEVSLGVDGTRQLDRARTVVKSPGVPQDAPVIQAARERAIEVTGELELAWRLIPNAFCAVTGTNGKTTTTELIGHLHRTAGRPVAVAGNVGTPLSSLVGAIDEDATVVCEASSFQLEDTNYFSPECAVFINLAPDHLDRHGTLDRYTGLKARVVQFAEPDDYAVLNGRDQIVRGFEQRTKAKVVWFDKHQPIPPMPLPGRHNMENALAAAAVGRIAGLSDDAINNAIRGFKGVEHRLELVGEWAGVRWYNDSKATNPDASRVALSAFPGAPVVLIAGGYGGGFDLREWVADVLANTEAVVLIGASAGELAGALKAHRKVARAESLEDAVSQAAHIARSGGVVLFSPAYKSFDMFKDFEDRGNQFKELVRKRFEA
jgi:UDP-N-acetylmuramoylalanine--D-glutamate ligase